MYREMIRSGRDTPVISEDKDQVTVLFRGQPPNTRITKFLAALPPEEQEDTDTLLIVLTLCRKRTTDAGQLAPIVQRSEAEAQAALRRLSSEPTSILEPTRGTINRIRPTYRLTADAITRLGNAVAYHGRTSDEIDRAKPRDRRPLRSWRRISACQKVALTKVERHDARVRRGPTILVPKASVHEGR